MQSNYIKIILEFLFNYSFSFQYEETEEEEEVLIPCPYNRHGCEEIEVCIKINHGVIFIYPLKNFLTSDQHDIPKYSREQYKYKIAI